MAYTTLENLNASSPTDIFQIVSEAVPIFPTMMLSAIFIILTMGSYFVMQRRFGKGDLPACCSVGGLVTVVCAIIMSLIPNFIQTYVVVVAIVLEILFVVWLFTSRGEVNE